MMTFRFMVTVSVEVDGFDGVFFCRARFPLDEWSVGPVRSGPLVGLFDGRSLVWCIEKMGFSSFCMVADGRSIEFQRPAAAAVSACPLPRPTVCRFTPFLSFFSKPI